MAKRETAPLIGEYLDVDAMAAAAGEERVAAPIRMAGDVAGPATSEQIRDERIRLDLVDRLGLPEGEAA